MTFRCGTGRGCRPEALIRMHAVPVSHDAQFAGKFLPIRQIFNDFLLHLTTDVPLRWNTAAIVFHEGVS